MLDFLVIAAFIGMIAANLRRRGDCSILEALVRAVAPLLIGIGVWNNPYFGGPALGLASMLVTYLLLAPKPRAREHPDLRRR